MTAQSTSPAVLAAIGAGIAGSVGWILVMLFFMYAANGFDATFVMGPLFMVISAGFLGLLIWYPYSIVRTRRGYGLKHDVILHLFNSIVLPVGYIMLLSAGKAKLDIVGLLQFSLVFAVVGLPSPFVFCRLMRLGARPVARSQSFGDE